MIKTNLNFTLAISLALILLLQTPVKAAEEIISSAVQPWTGDFEEMLERRQLRALVVYNKLLYFLDGPRQRGASYDALEGFRKFINEKYKLGSRQFNIVYIPVTRDQLIPGLLNGIGDVAVANLSITPARLEQVDFTTPIMQDVREVLVSGPSAPQVNSLEDLTGKQIYLRESSSYFTSLLHINQQFAANGMEPIQLAALDEYLEDSDLLEMVNAGLLPFAVVDNHKADFWAGVFDNLVLHEDMPFSIGGSIGWALRKNSPTLKGVLGQYIAQNKKGTLQGNMIFNRYLRDNKWIRNAYGEEELERFNDLIELFQKYAGEYEFDWLMLIAQGFQESGLDHSVKSPAGAVGVMQLLPSTATDPNVNIPDIDQLENNIHAGAKYLRFLRDRYIADSGADELNQTLLAFASYNAGPSKIVKLREEAAERGLNPNVWFGNVEHVAARRIGRETVQYVSNIYKYYISYKLFVDQRSERDAAKKKLKDAVE